VWICAAANGHIQATGVDEAGRMQYLYHPDWSTTRDKGKYARALQLAESLPRARGRITASLRRDDLDREQVLATAFRLLDQAAPRVGSERYFTAHGSRGLTTLQRRDAAVSGTVTSLRFPGKSGKRQSLEWTTKTSPSSSSCSLRVDRPALWRTCAAAALRSPAGRQRVRPHDDRRQLHREGFPHAARHHPRGRRAGAHRDHRHQADRKRAEVLAVKAAAAALGNTPTVAKSSYIDPRVFARYRRGELLDTTVSPESAIRALLGP
jgi:DNA topoisomerase IB